ncbi:MAG: hypothetical protein AB7O62_13970 [Pirellulales bacterium]
MSQETGVYLESYRLAQYAASLPCYICGQDNAKDAELCRHCFAPMAIAHQCDGKQQPPLMVGALGATGSGKTVYLGMLLDMLSRRPGTLQLMTRGPLSINMQQNTIHALANGAFPDKTPNEPDRWNWLHCQVAFGRRKQRAEVVMPDLPGESILDEIDHPNSYLGIRSFMARCSGMLILIDPSRARAGHQDQDFFAMKLLGYLHELDANSKKGWPHRPLALIFSKADQCEECEIDPERFAERHTPGLWRFCHQRFQRYKFFAAGVSGACAFRDIPRHGRVRVPLRIEPRGIIEPFEWLMKEMAN